MNNVDWSIYDNDSPSSSLNTNKSKTKQSMKSKKNEPDWEIFDPTPKKETGILDNIADYGKTLIKGSVEGLTRLGRVMGPTIDKSTPKVLQEQTENLEELLPTDEGYLQSSLRRGLRELPSAIGFAPGAALQTLPRTIAAGFVGEGAKELGAPEWVQTVAELTAYMGPDLTKKLLSKGSNKEIIEFGKKMGLTDEQITPLIQSKFKQKWLTKLSPKRGQTEKALSSTKESLQEGYKSIQKSEIASSPISKQAEQDLSKAMFTAFEEMPADVAKLIEDDFLKLIEKPMTGESLMNFYANINHYLGPKSKQLSLLKDPVKDAIKSISLELGKDFEMINNLYSKFYDISSKLKPDMASDLIRAGEALGLMGSIFTGYYPGIVAIIGEKATRKLAQQLLINPHLQNISGKIVDAINANKYEIATKLIHSFGHLIEKKAPEAANELFNLSEKDFSSVIKNVPTE